MWGRALFTHPQKEQGSFPLAWAHFICIRAYHVTEEWQMRFSDTPDEGHDWELAVKSSLHRLEPRIITSLWIQELQEWKLKLCCCHDLMDERDSVLEMDYFFFYIPKPSGSSTLHALASVLIWMGHQYPPSRRGNVPQTSQQNVLMSCFMPFP